MLKLSLKIILILYLTLLDFYFKQIHLNLNLFAFHQLIEKFPIEFLFKSSHTSVLPSFQTHFIRFNLKQLLVLIRDRQEIKKRKIEWFTWQERYTQGLCMHIYSGNWNFFLPAFHESMSNCLFFRGPIKCLIKHTERRWSL